MLGQFDNATGVEQSIAACTTVESPIRLGFLGLGPSGRRQLRAIASAPRTIIAAVADNTAGPFDQAAEEFVTHTPLQLYSLDELLECDLDGIIIATPTASRAEQAIAALEQGLAVYSQQPMAVSARDMARVVAAARANDRLLQVEHSYRQIQGMSAMRERVRRGDLGDIFAVDLTFHSSHRPEGMQCFDLTLTGGGCLLDHGTDLIDLLLWTFGLPKVTVTSAVLSANGRPLNPDLDLNESAHEDFAAVQLQLGNGAVVRISCSWNNHMGCDAVIDAMFHGTRAAARCHNLRGSFFDFEVSILHGIHREVLGRTPVDWVPRGVRSWLERLRTDASFDPEILATLPVARLIDACYGRPTHTLMSVTA